MPFFIQNTAGPGNGVFPTLDNDIQCVNRSGATVSKGEIVQIDLTASATEITTNDSNSYRPGFGDASDDAVWATVVNILTNSADAGGIFVVAQADVADNAVGKFTAFGVIEEAFVLGTNAAADPGQPLSVAGTTNSLQARSTPASNQKIVAHFMDAQDVTMTNRALKRVFLHQGLFGGVGTSGSF